MKIFSCFFVAVREAVKGGANCANTTKFADKICHIDRLIFYNFNVIIGMYKNINPTDFFEGEFE